MISNTFLILDIETIPDNSLWTPQKEDDFPPPYANQVVVIGVMWLDDAFNLKKLGVVAEGKGEPVILSEFSNFMDKYRPQLITFNGRRFDLPVIVHRSLKYGIPIPWYFQSKVRIRYTDEGHTDLCDELAEYGSSRYSSLDVLSRLIGLPGKDKYDGGDVQELYKSGEIETIATYCMTDVIQTAFLYIRYCLLKGYFNIDSYRDLIEQFKNTLYQNERLKDFIAKINWKELSLKEE